MTLLIPDDIQKAAEALSDRSGVAPEQLLLDALRAHFPPAPHELQAELDAWNLASDEDAARFEQSLEPG
jgi:hypothetical protein